VLTYYLFLVSNFVFVLVSVTAAHSYTVDGHVFSSLISFCSQLCQLFPPEFGLVQEVTLRYVINPSCLPTTTGSLWSRDRLLSLTSRRSIQFWSCLSYYHSISDHCCSSHQLSLPALSIFTVYMYVCYVWH